MAHQESQETVRRRREVLRCLREGFMTWMDSRGGGGMIQGNGGGGEGEMGRGEIAEFGLRNADWGERGN